MYSEKYRRNHEFTNMSITINTVPSAEPSPPERVAQFEEGTVLEQLLRGAVTEDERELLCLIDALVDEAWRLPVGKDRGRLTAKTLRGELRRAFTSHGRSKRRYYTAFYDIEKRVFT